MNKFNPIIPPECSLSLLYQQRSRRRISIPFVVFTILAVHVMFLGGLLVQGCKHAGTSAQIIPPSETGELAGPTVLANSVLPAPTEAGSPSAFESFSSPRPADGRGEVQFPSAGGNELAFKPGTLTAPPSGAAPGTEVAAASYVVRSGDTLGKIAKAKGTTAKSLRLVNRLSSDQIAVGQVLSLPEIKVMGGPRSGRAQNANPPRSGSAL